MDVLIDSCVWSLALRRSTPDARIATALRLIITDGRARLIGPIRQEVLSGIADHDVFLHLRRVLAAFPDIALRSEDFESAAEMANACRAKGVQGSHTDFLLCAVAKRHRLAIFTTDRDFSHFTKVLGLALYQP